MALPPLNGRCVVITGASRGLGAGIAEVCASHGMHLGLCSRGDPCLGSGDSVVSSRVDVTDSDAMATFVTSVEERFGEIDLWINNAGVLDPIAPIREVAVADFRDHIDINLTGVFIGTQLYIRHVRARSGGGVLINISSGAAWNGYAGWGAYCASKSGVERLTDCAQLEEADQGLRAYSVAPGIIDTDMQALIRSCDEEQFPMVEKFLEWKRDDAFNTSGFVARHLLELAFDPERKDEPGPIRLPDEQG